MFYLFIYSFYLILFHFSLFLFVNFPFSSPHSSTNSLHFCGVPLTHTSVVSSEVIHLCFTFIWENFWSICFCFFPRYGNFLGEVQPLNSSSTILSDTAWHINTCEPKQKLMDSHIFWKNSFRFAKMVYLKVQSEQKNEEVMARWMLLPWNEV